MRIGIDLDNTINYNENSKLFFRTLTLGLKDSSEIYIITNRDLSSYDSTVQELNSYGIHYDEVVITANKHKFILDNDINVYFDDTDEYFQKLPESVLVFKTRESGNFDFEEGKWFKIESS